MQTFNEINAALRTDSGAEYLGNFACMDTDILAAIASGKIDARMVACVMMASRGLDTDGKWIGFDKAKVLWRT